MNISFPEDIRPYVQSGMTARLVAGTFSMSRHVMRPLGQRQVNNYFILFRNVFAKDGTADDQVDMGTLNPSAIANASNHIVLLVVDIPKAANIVGEFVAYRANKQDGGSAVLACWCPDGGMGRFIVEQDEYFLTGWLISSAQVFKQSATLWGGILGFAVLGCILGMFLQCLMFLVVPVMGFLFTKWLNAKKAQGKLLDKFWMQNAVQKWATALTERGEFRTKYNQAFQAEVADARL